MSVRRVGWRNLCSYLPSRLSRQQARGLVPPQLAEASSEVASAPEPRGAAETRTCFCAAVHMLWVVDVGCPGVGKGRLATEGAGLSARGLSEADEAGYEAGSQSEQHAVPLSGACAVRVCAGAELGSSCKHFHHGIMAYPPLAHSLLSAEKFHLAWRAFPLPLASSAWTLVPTLRDTRHWTMHVRP